LDWSFTTSFSIAAMHCFRPSSFMAWCKYI
jgi:hypothetical protein